MDQHWDFGTELVGLVAFMTIVCRMPRRVVETNDRNPSRIRGNPS